MRARSASFGVVLCALFLSACIQVRFSGGGTIPGVSGGNANITISGENCGSNYDPITGTGDIRGRLSVTDKNASSWQPNGVKFNGTVSSYSNCLLGLDTESEACTACYDLFGEELSLLMYGGTFDYQSMNKAYSGTGSGYFCILGTVGSGPQSVPNVVGVEVTSGPYSSYTNAGTLQGNINTTNCPPPQQTSY